MHREKSGSSGDTGARARSDRVNDGRSLLRPIRSLLRCNAESMVRSAQHDLFRCNSSILNLAGLRPAGSHCENSGSSDGTGASARSDRAKSEVFRDRSASAGVVTRYFSRCLIFWCFWIKPKAPKDQALRKVAEAVRSGGPRACHVRTQTNNLSCAQRTTDSALRKIGKKNGRRMRRRHSAPAIAK